MTAERPRGDLGPPDLVADEKTTQLCYLNYLRDSLIAKTAGLTDAQAHTPGVPSGTSLAWLLSHLAGVEFNWLVWSYAGVDEPAVDSFAAVDPATPLSTLVADYRTAIDRANIVIDECADLDRRGVRTVREHEPPTMRWVLAHLIEETARHVGHADILRELLDGAVGR